jgi:hypothetical protein
MAVSNPTHVISGAEYVAIAGYYGNLRAQLTSAANYLYSAVYKIVQFNEFEPTLDLLQAFYDTYTLQTQVLNNNTPYNGAVRAINNHVLSRARDGAGDPYTDINDWFTDEALSGTALSAEWQDMCEAVGFTIDDGFVA